MLDAEKQLNHYFEFYNNERLHQALNYRNPSQIYYQREEK